MNMIDRVAKAIDEASSFGQGPRWEAELPGLARAALKAIRDFNTEDFTLSEASAIRCLIDDALEESPLTSIPG